MRLRVFHFVQLRVARARSEAPQRGAAATRRSGRLPRSPARISIFRPLDCVSMILWGGEPQRGGGEGGGRPRSRARKAREQSRLQPRPPRTWPPSSGADFLLGDGASSAGWREEEEGGGGRRRDGGNGSSSLERLLAGEGRSRQQSMEDTAQPLRSFRS